jgi:hypothetical protein
VFGRPKGVDGSFVAEDLRPAKFRDEDVFRATDAKADPVLQEAFGRPATAAESLQRHPADAGALDGETDGAEQPDDPWRDPGAGVALGTRRSRSLRPSRRRDRPASSACATCSSAAASPTSPWPSWASSRC